MKQTKTRCAILVCLLLVALPGCLDLEAVGGPGAAGAEPVTCAQNADGGIPVVLTPGQAIRSVFHVENDTSFLRLAHEYTTVSGDVHLEILDPAGRALSNDTHETPLVPTPGSTSGEIDLVSPLAGNYTLVLVASNRGAVLSSYLFTVTQQHNGAAPQCNG